MVFRTIYRFRVQIQDRPYCFLIHLCAHQDQPLRFQELFERIRSNLQDLRINDYSIVIDHHRMVIHDDQTLHQALATVPDQHKYRLEIMLCRKPDPVAAVNVPVIKPVVVRWINPSGSYLSPPAELETETRLTHRKDSGISFEPKLFLPPLEDATEKRRDTILPAITSITAQLDSPIHHHHQPQAQHLLPPPPLSPSSPSPPSRTPSYQLSPPQSPPTLSLSPKSSPYWCNHVVDPVSGRLCDQTFKRSYDLTRHQTIHLKNRPFCYCDQCGKKFTRLDALRRHERAQGHRAKRRRQNPCTQQVRV